MLTLIIQLAYGSVSTVIKPGQCIGPTIAWYKQHGFEVIGYTIEKVG